MMQRFQSTVLFARLCMGGIILFSLILSCAAYLLPMPESGIERFTDNQSDADYRMTVAVFAFFSGLTLGSAIILASLRGFTTGFKRSYYFICCGLGLHSVAAISYYLSLQFLPAWNTAGPRLVAGLCYTLASLAMYIGVRRFALLLQVKSTWLSSPVITAACAAAAGSMFFLPPTDSMFDQTTLNILHAVTAVEAVSYFAVAMLIWKIRVNASPAYSKALWAFWWMIVPFVVSRALFLAADYIERDLLLTVSAIPSLLSHIPMLMTGYAFYRLSQIQADASAVSGSASVVDIVVYTASLVSRPHEVDDILDSLRMVTSRHDDLGEKLSAEEERLLHETYLRLEEYLTTKEALRSYTKEGLRQLLHEKFGFMPVMYKAVV